MGKITVKHYLNTKVRPSEGLFFEPEIGSKPSKEDAFYYPLYIQITVKRKTTKFRSRIFIYRNFFKKYQLLIRKEGVVTTPDAIFNKTYFTENEYKELLKDDHFVSLLNEEEKIIKDIFTYTKLHEKENFDIKDFGKHFDTWIRPVRDRIDNLCKGEFTSVMALSDDYRALFRISNTEVPFSMLYKTLDLISRSSKNPTCRTEFNEYLHNKAEHLFIFYTLFEEYTEKNIYINAFQWKEFNHQEHFKNFIDNKNLGEKTRDLINGILSNLNIK